MININQAKSFCCEDISLIENYEKAINDTTQVWVCHHKKGIELSLSRKELKDNNLYYKRPASELQFLTSDVHTSIHNKGKKCSEEVKRKISESKKGYTPWNKGLKGAQKAWNKGVPRSKESKRKQSESMKGHAPWNKGLKGAQKAWNKGVPQSEETKSFVN